MFTRGISGVAMAITTLIDKQDNFEIIRDQIAGIIALEVTQQKALAATDGKHPENWSINTYLERSNPWQQYMNESPDKTPIVNVWYDNSNYDKTSSNVTERQKTISTFNIDCYGYGSSSNNISGGHVAGDMVASTESQRAIRLIRNILMSSVYTYLGLRGMVWGRWISTVNVFQPQQEVNAKNVVASRITLEVVHNEFSPQYQPETLEYVAIDTIRQSDGLVLLGADYDYTT